MTHKPPKELWEYKGCHGSDYYGKKRRERMAAGDMIDYLVIYQHYNWMCHLCGEQIDRALSAPDPECATIDHVHRLSDGGLHEWKNLAPAHLKCNKSKE